MKCERKARGCSADGRYTEAGIQANQAHWLATLLADIDEVFFPDVPVTPTLEHSQTTSAAIPQSKE